MVVEVLAVTSVVDIVVASGVVVVEIVDVVVVGSGVVVCTVVDVTVVSEAKTWFWVYTKCKLLASNLQRPANQYSVLVRIESA